MPPKARKHTQKSPNGVGQARSGPSPMLPPLPRRKSSTPQATGHTPKEATAPMTSKKAVNKDISGKSKVLPSIQNGGGRLAAVAQQPAFRDSMDLFNEMLVGRLNDLPAKPPSEVRIFLSSTFTDMKVERNWLSTEAYPQLKQFCGDLGLDFSMLDMRWGVTEDAINDHITEKLCLKEVANCHRNSIGPSFVAFMGNKYGYRPLPSGIPCQEFELLLQEALELQHPHLETLKTWYRLDSNAIPKIYCLRPIKQIIPHFGDRTPGKEQTHMEAAKEWQSFQNDLQDVLRQAALSAEKKGLFTAKQRHVYFRSVTECEIAEGILETENPNLHALCYYRNMIGLGNEVMDQKNARRFMDCITTDGKTMQDEEVTGMLTTLCSSSIPAAMNFSNIKKYEINWVDGGTDPEEETHRTYLEQLTDDFAADLKQLIYQGLAEKNHVIPQTEYYTTYEELLHHLRFTVDKCETFRGQQETLDAIKEKLQGPASSHLVLAAESGVGKTSLIAMTMKLIPEWFGSDSIRIVRYLGTSTQSSDIFYVLRNIVGQLADFSSIFCEPDNMKTFNRIVKYLPRLLRTVARKVKGHIYILLDSIDQLKKGDNAYDMKWLPTDVPRNVTFIISSLVSRFGIVNNLKTLLPNEQHYLVIDALPTSTGTGIMDIMLKKNNRTLTEEQRNLIIPEMERFPNALYMKLLIDRSLTWSSFTPVEEIRIASTVKEAIVMLFNDMESQFGKILVSRTLGYLTEGLNGLTEVELEDALSCDDDVLDEVYQYHDPPVEGVVRLPALLWSRMKESISRYLTEKPSAGKTALSWYHRQFHETATTRYCQGENERLLHTKLTDLYRASEGIQRSIFLSKRNKQIENADRQVTRQICTTSNLRMLECIPFHCQKSGDRNLQMQALCNLKFMVLRKAASGVFTLITDITKCLKTEDQELELVLDCIKVLKFYAGNRNLAIELLLRLNPEEAHPNIKSLMKETRGYLQDTGFNVIPTYAFEGNLLDFSHTSCEKIVFVGDDVPEVVVKLSSDTGDGVSYLRVNLVDKTATVEKMKYQRVVAETKMSTWASNGSYKYSNMTDIAVNSSESHMLAVYSHKSLCLWDIKNRTLKMKDIEMNNVTHITGLMWMNGSKAVAWAESAGNKTILIVINVTKKTNVKTVHLPHRIKPGTVSCTKSHFLCVGVTQEGTEIALIIVDTGSYTVSGVFEIDNGSTWCHSADAAFVKKHSSWLKIDLNSGSSEQVNYDIPEVKSLVLTPDNKLIVASTTEESLVLISTCDGQVVGQMTMKQQTQAMFTNDMMELVTIDENGVFSVWNWLQLKHHCQNENGPTTASSYFNDCTYIQDMCFSADSNSIVTTGAGRLEIWVATTLALTYSDKTEATSVTLVCNQGKDYVMLKTASGHLMIFDTESKSTTPIFDTKDEVVLCFDVDSVKETCYALVKTPKGYYVDSLSLRDQSLAKRCKLPAKISLENPQMKLTKSRSYLIISHQCSENELFALRKQEKSQNLKESYGDTLLYAWDVRKESPTLKVCHRQLTSVPCLVESWLPTGEDMVILGRSRITTFWNVANGKNDQKMGPNKIAKMYRPYWIEGETELHKRCHGVIRCISLSEDGNLCATGSDDGYLMVYETTNGHSVHRSLLGAKPHHATPITQMCLSPCGTYVASLGSDHVLKIHHVASKCDLVLETKVTGNVEKMVFGSHDNKLIILLSRGNVLSRTMMFDLKSN